MAVRKGKKISARRTRKGAPVLRAPAKLDALAKIWRFVWRPPDRRPIYEWARENVNLPPGVYKTPGLFQVERSRYLIEPFDALKDDRVRVVTAQMGVRAGKSMLADIWMPWTFLNAPGGFMWNVNVDTLARRHMRTKLLPILRGIRDFKELLPDDPRKCTGQELIFKNGLPLYVQGPSIDNLQGVSARNLFEDELWMRDAGRHQQAVARLGDFEDIHASKLLNAGQAGVEDDDMDTEFKAGHQAEWQAPCLGCGEYFTPVSSGLREDGTKHGLIWDQTAKDAHGFWILARVEKTVKYGCPRTSCRYEHTDSDRSVWNQRGRYLAMNPEAPATHRSYHVYSTVTRRWDLLASELAGALNALMIGDPGRMMLYTQKRDARAWSEMMLMDATNGPMFELNTEWKEQAHCVIGVDHQADGENWAVVAGVSKSGEFRRFWAGRVLGEDGIKARAEEFAKFKPTVLVDAAWDTNTVYGWCARNNWIAMKGDDRAFFIHYVGPKGAEKPVQRSWSKPIAADPEKGKATQGKRFCKLIHFSAPAIKSAFKGLMDKGRIVEPKLDPNSEDEKDYRRQMRGQWRKPVKCRVTGKVSWKWCDNGNDHMRDCWNMITTFAKAKGCVPDFERVEPEKPETPAGVDLASQVNDEAQ